MRIASAALRPLVVGLGISTLSAYPAVDVQGVRVGRDGDRTRVVFDLSAPPAYRVFTLSAPDRLVIDMQQARMNSDVDVALFQGTPVLALRSGMHPNERLRLVLDLAVAVSFTDFALQPSADGSRDHRLVIDLRRSAQALAAPGSAAGPGATLSMETDPTLADDGGPGESAMQARSGSTVAATRAAVAGGGSPGLPPQSGQHTGGPGRPETEARGAPADAGHAGESAVTASSPLPEDEPVGLPPASEVPARGQDRSRPAGDALSIEFSGTWQHEWAWATERNEAQKFESILQPRWDLSLSRGASVTAILRLRGDTIGDLGPDERRPPNYSDISRPWFNSDTAELSLRELYVDFRVGRSDWRLGKQQVVWGQADGFKVLDVVNPQSYREGILDDFDSSRIPLWTANVSLPIGDTTSLQLLWIPDPTYHELAELDTPFAFTTPRIIPAVPIAGVAEVDRPDSFFDDSDAGFALTGFAGGWDFSLNYLYRYLDVPVLPVRLRGMLPILEPEYRRSHLLGGTASTVLGDTTLRAELAYSTDTYQPTDSLANEAVAESEDLSVVLGLDWALSMDALLSAQLFNSTLLDHDDAMGRDRHEQLLTLLYQQDFANAAWRFRAIGIHSINDGDTQLQFRLSYWLRSDLQAWLGGDVLTGSRRGLFGQFDDEDRALVGLEYGF